MSQGKGRISTRFEQLRAEGRAALIPYIVAGDPSLEITVPLMHQLVASGADLIELGVPFSDPMAEGPVIQLGHERALARHVSLRDCLDCVAKFREEDSTTPVLLMGYSNPIERMGYADIADAAAEAGLDGLLTVDMPPEEVDLLNVELKRVGIDNIFLVAPTTPEERVAKIAEAATGFIYYVSFKGVTGAGHLDTKEVVERVGSIRQHTDLPVAVGFGIKDAASAGAIAATADAVVVGSALVQLLADSAAAAGDDEAALAAARDLLSSLRSGIDSVQASA